MAAREANRWREGGAPVASQGASARELMIRRDESAWRNAPPVVSERSDAPHVASLVERIDAHAAPSTRPAPVVPGPVLSERVDRRGVDGEPTEVESAQERYLRAQNSEAWK